MTVLARTSSNLTERAAFKSLKKGNMGDVNTYERIILKKRIYYVVPWLKWLVTGFPPRRPGIDLRSVVMVD
jgi:hypothetical protein